MPELPEVETITRQLQHVAVGKKISAVEVYHPKSLHGDKKILIGQKIKTIERKAKIIIIRFETKFPLLLIHLKMTGQLIYIDKHKRVAGGHPSLDWLATLPNKHTRIEIVFDDQSKLFFNDMRLFGWLKIMTSQKQLDQELSEISSVEPLSSQFTTKALAKALQNTARSVKLILMDQKKISGIGNIYANEALFDAGIDPRRPARSLNGDEIKALHNSLNKVIKQAIYYGGTSQRDYRQLHGQQGTYQDHFLVYNQEGKSCVKCKDLVVKLKLSGRGTFFCPKCQK